MSRINSCYPLCPLIDQKSFFGISDDCEIGYVVVTLGKNMVVRYKLSDQKQVNSWNSKVGLRLSSPVVFDRSSKQYVGVFNSNTIQFWSEFDVDLNKVKKYKFKDNIHCVLSNSSFEEGDDQLSPSLVIVFKNGCVAPLTPEMLANRKQLESVCNESPSILTGKDRNFVIEDTRLLVSAVNKAIIVALVCSNSLNGNLVCYFMPLDSKSFQPVCCNLSYRHRGGPSGSDVSSPTAANEKNVKLTSYAFVSSDPFKLITCWSDGGLYCLDFHPADLQDSDNQFPGQKIMDVRIINTNLKVAILPLDNIGCHIALYGSDPSEEGALLSIINIKHKVVQFKYDIKLYSTSPKLWSGGPNHLLLIVGQYLAVANYRLVSQKLAALVGTQVETCSNSKLLHKNWLSEKQDLKNKTLKVVGPGSLSGASTTKIESHSNRNGDSIDMKAMFCDDIILSAADEKQLSHVKDNVKSLFKEGLSEAGICERILPVLIETNDTLAIIWLFKEFKDVPFHCTLLVIGYCLEKLEKYNLSEDNGGDDNSQVMQIPHSDDDDFPVKNEATDRKKDNLMKVLLCTLSISIVPDNKALQLVRSELSLASGLSLMNYLTDFMTERPGNIRLVEWGILLMDAYYQSFVLSSDAKIIKNFKRFNNCIKNQMMLMSTWQDLMSLIDMIKSGKGVPKPSSCSLYNCDQLTMY